MRKITYAFVILCILLTLSACGDKAPAPPDASGGISEELTSTAVSETTSAKASEETPESTTQEEASSAVSAAASSQAASSKAAGTTSKTNSTATTSSAISTKPADPPPVTPDPPAKSIYDRPYNIAEIEKDMEKYIVSKGGNYDWSMNLDNFGWWIDPLPTSSKWYGDKLKNTLREDIDARMMHKEFQYFRVYFNPLGDGEYEVMVLCG